MNRKFTVSLSSTAWLFAACLFFTSTAHAGSIISKLHSTQPDEKSVHISQQEPFPTAVHMAEPTYGLNLNSISRLTPEEAAVKQKEAIFIIGSAAAGKSTVRKNLYPTYSIIDPDELKSEAWSLLQKKYKKDPKATITVAGKRKRLSKYANLLEKNYDESNSSMVQLSHALSKKLSKKAFQEYLTINNSLIYDTTGSNIRSMKKEMLAAKQRGFKIILLYVYAPIDICLERNATRARCLPDNLVKKVWHSAQSAWIELREFPAVDMIKEINTTYA